jgi:hypothetical protein
MMFFGVMVSVKPTLAFGSVVPTRLMFPFVALIAL